MVVRLYFSLRLDDDDEEEVEEDELDDEVLESDDCDDDESSPLSSRFRFSFCFLTSKKNLDFENYLMNLLRHYILFYYVTNLIAYLC